MAIVTAKAKRSGYIVTGGEAQCFGARQYEPGDEIELPADPFDTPGAVKVSEDGHDWLRWGAGVLFREDEHGFRWWKVPGTLGEYHPIVRPAGLPELRALEAAGRVKRRRRGGR